MSQPSEIDDFAVDYVALEDAFRAAKSKRRRDGQACVADLEARFERDKLTLCSMYGVDPKDLEETQ